MVPLNGPLAARSGFVWIDWWSSVASCEQVHLLLRYRHPIGGVQTLAYHVEQTSRVDTMGCH